MSNISKIKIPSGEVYDLKDTGAVASVTKSGTDVTVTKRDGTSTSFGSCRVVVSAIQPVGGSPGDIWLVLSQDS